MPSAVMRCAICRTIWKRRDRMRAVASVRNLVVVSNRSRIGRRPDSTVSGGKIGNREPGMLDGAWSRQLEAESRSEKSRPCGVFTRLSLNSSRVICSIALSHQRVREPGAVASANPAIAGSRKLCTAATLLIGPQLLIGATMRHQHAGLAIPDFPAATVESGLRPILLRLLTTTRFERKRRPSIRSRRSQIVLQMAHRNHGAWHCRFRCAWSRYMRLGSCVKCLLLRRLALGWSLLVLGQAVLGAATIWTNKSADIATAHVAFGALSLGERDDARARLQAGICGRQLRNLPWSERLAIPGSLTRKIPWRHRRESDSSTVCRRGPESSKPAGSRSFPISLKHD